MIHLKLFEGFSNEEEIREEILNNHNIRNIIYDLIDVSLERLDEVEEDEYLDKSIIFEISIEDTKTNFSDSIVGGKFNRSEEFKDSDIYWISGSQLYTILKMLKSENKKLRLTFSVVYGEDDNLKQLNCGEIIEKMSILYPDIEIDTYSPWDIN